MFSGHLYWSLVACKGSHTPARPSVAGCLSRHNRDVCGMFQDTDATEHVNVSVCPTRCGSSHSKCDITTDIIRYQSVNQTRPAVGRIMIGCGTTTRSDPYCQDCGTGTFPLVHVFRIDGTR